MVEFVCFLFLRIYVWTERLRDRLGRNMGLMGLPYFSWVVLGGWLWEVNSFCCFGVPGTGG